MNLALAFDDQTSTFIIPSGAGFEVVFCPGARSTTIIDTSLEQMQQLSQRGRANQQAALITRKARQEMFK
jgi:inosine/xanthosine triphosphate pyrophosphatase family protein